MEVILLTINSFNMVLYTCVFLLPGFIINSIVESLVPPRKFYETKYFFSCLFYSVVNCAVLSWAYILIINSKQKAEWTHWLLLLSTTIIGAIIIGLCIGLLKQNEVIEHLCRKCNFKKIHPIPTAWDYYFSKSEPSWVIVNLKSGKTVYGLYSYNSFASSQYDDRDIYIEKVYQVTSEMAWEEDERSKGILISKEDIESIEFYS